jgi:hypothetical protein
MSGVDDVEGQRRSYKTPHNAHHPIPTIKRYREEQQRRQDDYGQPDGAGDAQPDQRNKRDKLGDAYNAFTGKGDDEIHDGQEPYESENKNLVPASEHTKEAEDHAGETANNRNKQLLQDTDDDEDAEDTTQGHISHQADPKKARKQMKKFTADGTEREVTDPVTHLPVRIHDFTDKDLKRTPKNPPPAGSEPETMTGMDAIDKSDEQLADEEQESKDSHAGTQVLFPPPDFEATRTEITTVYTHALTVGLGAVAVSLVLIDTLFWPSRHATGWTRQVWKGLELFAMLVAAAGITLFMRQYTQNRIKNVWDVEVWEAERKRGQKLARSQVPESTQWLNSLFASVWPLINPDLFTSIADTLEVSTPEYTARIELTLVGRHASFAPEHGSHGCSRRSWTRLRGTAYSRRTMASHRCSCSICKLGREVEVSASGER